MDFNDIVEGGKGEEMSLLTDAILYCCCNSAKTVEWLISVIWKGL